MDSQKQILVMMNGFPKERQCIDCGGYFMSVNPINVRCGSRSKKTGCTYRHRLEWQKKVKYPKDKIRYKEYLKKYSREYKRKYRLNPIVKKRMSELNKIWRNSEKGKKYIKDNYKKYLPLRLESNRHRKLLLKGVIGKHSKQEWEECKKYYKYKCVLCGVDESLLKRMWKGTFFNKLTRDHIIPISKGGTDFISNIQPLCISCNARKHNR